MDTERRTEVLPPMRVTIDELKRFAKKALEGGETLSAFARRAMDECRPLPIEDDEPKPVRLRRRKAS